MKALEANMPFNDTQILLLQSFSRIQSEEEKADVQAQYCLIIIERELMRMQTISL